MLEALLIKFIGWKCLSLYGSPFGFDRWRFLSKNLEAGPLRTLDVACGSGVFTIYSSKLKNYSVGIDYDSNRINKALNLSKLLKADNICFIKMDIKCIGSAKLGVFDQIVCFEFIEHVLDDEKLIFDLSKLLKPEGVLLLTTPFYYKSSPYSIINIEKGGHVRHGYTHDELTKKFMRCNLQIIERGYINGPISFSLNNIQEKLSKISKPIGYLLIFPLRILQFLDPWIANRINYPFSYHTLSVIAKKI